MTTTLIAGIAIATPVVLLVFLALLLRAHATIEGLREENRIAEEIRLDALFNARCFEARLTALRRNCFLTNEKGNRVRYSKASEALRERAESN